MSESTTPVWGLEIYHCMYLVPFSFCVRILLHSTMLNLVFIISLVLFLYLFCVSNSQQLVNIFLFIFQLYTNDTTLIIIFQDFVQVMLFLRFIRAVACSCRSFIFLLLYSVLLCDAYTLICLNLSTHSPVNGHSGFSQLILFLLGSGLLWECLCVEV